MLNTFHLFWYRNIVLICGRAVKDLRDWMPKPGQGVLTALKHLAGTPHRTSQWSKDKGIKDRAWRQPITSGQLLPEAENSEVLLQHGRNAYQGDVILRMKCKTPLFVFATCTIQEYTSAPLRNMHKQRHVTPFHAQGLFFFHKLSCGHILQSRKQILWETMFFM